MQCRSQRPGARQVAQACKVASNRCISRPTLQLREVLKSGGPEQLMQRLYCDYLQYKLEASTPGPMRPGPGPAWG